MLSIAETIIERRKGAYNPFDFRDTYQDALRGLVENNLKGIATTPCAIAEPAKVIDLMEALNGAWSTAAHCRRRCRGEARSIGCRRNS